VVRWPYKLVADLRFGLFELYDLVHDPRERENLTDQRPDLVADLKGEVYGWLDSLAPRPEAAAPDPVAAALDWGRLGDRRAVAPLSRVVMDRRADRAQRVEAARMLGHLADEQASRSLVSAMADASSPVVAAEAAIALGRMYDARARNALRGLVRAEDPDLRVRAAVSLGRLRDAEAVPALIEALWIATTDYERQEAVRWLGRLRDARAVEPLIELLPEARTRFLVVAAIGMIGDRRAYERLSQVLTWDTHTNVRDATVQGLGLLGDPRAIPAITKLAAEEPSLGFATETLVRLGAIASGAIGGTDFELGAPGLRDFGSCYAGPVLHDWDYQRRTHCTTRRATAALALKVPKAVAEAEHGVVVAVAIKRSDAARPADLQLTLGDHALPKFAVDGSWSEERFTLPPGSLAEGRVQARLASADPTARFAIDHILLLPLNSVVLAQREAAPP
jgi:HEAT repeats